MTKALALFLMAIVLITACGKKKETAPDARPEVRIIVTPSADAEKLLCKASVKSNYKSDSFLKLKKDEYIQCNEVNIEGNDGTLYSEGVSFPKSDVVKIQMRINEKVFMFSVQAPRSVVIEAPVRGGSVEKSEQIKIRWNTLGDTKSWSVYFDAFAIGNLGTYELPDTKSYLHLVTDNEASFKLAPQILERGTSWNFWLKATTRYCDLSADRGELDPYICSESTEVFSVPFADPAI